MCYICVCGPVFVSVLAFHSINSRPPVADPALTHVVSQQSRLWPIRLLLYHLGGGFSDHPTPSPLPLVSIYFITLWEMFTQTGATVPIHSFNFFFLVLFCVVILLPPPQTMSKHAYNHMHKCYIYIYTFGHTVNLHHQSLKDYFRYASMWDSWTTYLHQGEPVGQSAEALLTRH